jgi:capsular exopolysaccharide synthesis family protein
MSEGESSHFIRFDAQDAIAALWRNKRWLAFGALTGLALGAVVHQLLPKPYTATTTVLVEAYGPPGGLMQGPAHLSMRERLQTLRYRIESDTWLARALERVPGAVPSADSIRPRIGFEVLDAASREAAVFSVSYTDDDPERARDIVTALTGQLMDERSKERADQAAQTVRLLQGEAEQSRQEIATLGVRVEEELRTRARVSNRGVALAPSEGRADRSARLAALQRIEEQVSRAESTFTSDHPALKQLYAERRALLQRIRTSPASPVPSEGGLTDTEPGSERSALQHEYEASVDRYARLIDRLTEVRMTEQLERDGSARELLVLRAPKVPTQPDSLPLPLLLIGGTLLGTGLAAAALLARSFLRPSFTDDPERLRTLSGLPVVAAIPVLRPAQRTRPPIDAMVVAAHAPQSRVGERYRRLLPHLHGGPDGAPVVLVASAGNGDGRSLSAANLAAGIATADPRRQILVIDTDVRRPAQHRLFGVPRGPGLVDAVMASATLGQVAVRTAIPNLHVLAAGGTPEDALGLIADERFAALIDEARRKFQVVFLDAPPVGDSVDAALLSRLATLAVFVIRTDSTQRVAAARALTEIGVPVGLLLNAAGRFDA